MLVLNPKHIAVFASGGGTNFQALIDNIHQRYAIICALITDNPKAGAIERARAAHIPVYSYDAKALGEEAFFWSVQEQLSGLDPDLIVLAGFLKILPASVVRQWPAINVHPSLIPSFCGKGMYGIKVHEAALAYGVKVSGCTVHFVSEEADAGPVIFQEAVKVKDTDSPEDLQARILPNEHALLCRAVQLFCEGKLSVEGRIVKAGRVPQGSQGGIN